MGDGDTEETLTVDYCSVCLSALPQEQTSCRDGSLNFLHSCRGSRGQAMAVPPVRDTGAALQALPREVLVKLELPDTWEERGTHDRAQRNRTPGGLGAVAGAGFSAPLMCFDSLDPHMATVDEIIRKKKKHMLAHSRERRASL